jgi:hypothetical protein
MGSRIPNYEELEPQPALNLNYFHHENRSNIVPYVGSGNSYWPPITFIVLLHKPIPALPLSLLIQIATDGCL